MIEGYKLVKEIAAEWGIKPHTIQPPMCADGKIDEAVKFGNTWAIPCNDVKPIDKRIKSGKYFSKEDI